MKKLLTLVMLATGLLSGSLLAAEFSGTVTWKMRVDITDPEMKKQMAESQAQLADPKMQEQIKAAQEAMNSPEMQAMMKANPQMKEMMEKQMKALPKAGAASGNPFPQGFTIQVKGPRSLAKTEGGFAAGEVLSLADKNVAYQIDREARTYRKLPGDFVKESVGDAKVTPTKETTKVLGYTCRQFLVETNESEGKVSYSVWATNEIPGLDAQSLRRLRLGSSSSSDFLSKIDGVPLKMEATTAKMKMFMEATSVKPEALSDSLFVLPQGFKEIAAQ